MDSKIKELNQIIEKFATSGWDLIEKPSKEWLKGGNNKDALLKSIKQAVKECGNCGCEYDSLYQRALELLKEPL